MIRGKRKALLAQVFLVQKMRENGYDGLFNEREWCWCTVDKIAPCSGVKWDCDLARYYKLPIICPKCKLPLLEDDDIDETMQRAEDCVVMLLPVYRPKLMCVYCKRHTTGKPVKDES